MQQDETALLVNPVLSQRNRISISGTRPFVGLPRVVSDSQ